MQITSEANSQRWLIGNHTAASLQKSQAAESDAPAVIFSEDEATAMGEPQQVATQTSRPEEG